MADRKRQFALVVSVVMLSVMLFASFYIISETDHECTEETCPICAHIDQFEAMLSGSDTGGAMAAAAAIAIFTALILLSDGQAFCLTTPATRKVRMNS